MLEYFGDEMVDATLVKGVVGSRVKGVWVPGAPGAGVPIKMIAPQPVNARELQLLEDGEHVRNFVKTWTEADVTTRDNTRDADFIVYAGREFKVMQVENREPLGKYKKVFLHEKTIDE